MMSDGGSSAQKSTPVILLGLLGIFLLIPATLLFMETVALPLSAVGRIYVMGFLAFAAGLALLLRWPRAATVVIAASLVGSFATLFVRVAWTGASPPDTRVVLPAGEPEPLLSRMLPERDGVLLATGLFGQLGFASRRELEGFVPAIDRAYDDYAKAQGEVSSPLIGTVLTSQSSDSFDLVFFSAENVEADTNALIFLHGFAGNWSLLCWIVANAVAPLGIATACPSTDLTGDWSKDDAVKTVDATAQWLRDRGAHHIYLAGLSQGAASLGDVVNKSEEHFAGVLMLFGIDPGYASNSQPAVVVYGRNDTRFPADYVLETVEDLKRRGVPLDVQSVSGDHFALLKRREEVSSMIRGWLERQISARPPQ